MTGQDFYRAPQQSAAASVWVGYRGATAAAFAMNEDFSRTLENQMDIFNSPDGDQVRFVMNFMAQNVLSAHRSQQGKKIRAGFSAVLSVSENCTRNCVVPYSFINVLPRSWVWRVMLLDAFTSRDGFPPVTHFG